MSECNHNCDNCESNGNCSQQIEKEPLNSMSCVRKVIGIVSGKGGVGKSFITALLAASAQRNGYQSAILDADITGPSIPKAFGVSGSLQGSDMGLFPAVSAGGIQIVSTNLLLPEETDPVIWRGPVIAGMVKQFWSDVIWTDVDYMFVDMPPGTGDVPLTVFQSLPVDGIIIVTSPQELVGMIVQKAVKMAEMMDIPILGLVENMAYFECPDCHRKHYIFGESHGREIAQKHQIAKYVQIPLDPEIAGYCDQGKAEQYQKEWCEELLSIVKD